MSDVDRRFGSWLELVSELLATPGTGDFPRAVIEAALIMTFGCQVSWNWRHRDGTAGFELAKRPDLTALAPELLEQWDACGGLDLHPLIRWFAHARDSEAMTVGRVPSSVARADGPRCCTRCCRPTATSSSSRSRSACAGVEHRAFVLARGVEDFSDEDLALARRIQPLLQLLDRQAQVLEERRAGTARASRTGADDPAPAGRRPDRRRHRAPPRGLTADGAEAPGEPLPQAGRARPAPAVLAAQEAALLEPPPPRRAAGVLVGGPYAS